MKVLINIKHTVDKVETSRLIEGIFTDSTFIYNDEGFKVQLELKKDEIILTKMNNDYKITINFKEGLESNINYESASHSMLLNVKTMKLRMEDEIYIHYVVEEINEIKFNLKYEVLE